MKIFDEVIHPTLLDILYIICEHKYENETLKDYLFRQTSPSPPSNTYYKKFFNKGQLEKIDSNPLGDEYDTSLFAACLPLITEYNPMLSTNQAVVDDLKDKFKKIKDIRNDISHNLLSVPVPTVEQYARNELITHMNGLLDVIGTTFGCRTGTASRKLLLQKRIDEVMAIKQRDYDNEHVYKLYILLAVSTSLLVVSGVINFQYFMKY